MIKLTSIVQSHNGAVISVRAHRDWMGDTEINAYLEGVQPVEGMSIMFARVTLYSDVGDTDGGWLNAYRCGDRWDLAVG